MPILGAEANLHPRQLLSDLGLSEFSGSQNCNWCVLMTKPRQEKSVARDLLSKDVPFYLPLVKRDNFIRGRRVRSHIPLFTGYVFCFGDEDQRVEAMKTNRIAQTLQVLDQSQLWNDLRQIERLIAADAPLTIESRLQAGRRVRIKSGVMKGVEGTVVVRRPRSRLLVAVHFLQSGASIEIDDFMLEPID